MISTYPPRSCGLATFCHDVVTGLAGAGLQSRIVAIDEGPTIRSYPPEVWARLRSDNRETYATLGRKIAQSTAAAVAVQHEFGIFGGADGEWLLDLYAEIEKPIFTTLHTVLPKPSENQRLILAKISAYSRSTIVLSEVARTLLAEVYGISENVIVVPHGVPDVPWTATSEGKKRFDPALVGRPIVSTFGLMSRGKGLEYAVEALRRVKNTVPDVLYLIAGRTHPTILEHEGESYRSELKALIREYQLGENIFFIDQFLELDELLALLAATDVYFTPYINPDQVVSGTLAYAMGAGKAILSTPYLYAQELLADQRGLLCEFCDSAGMAEQLEMLLSDDVLRARFERRSYQFGRTMIWPQVSRQLAAIYMGATTTDAFCATLTS